MTCRRSPFSRGRPRCARMRLRGWRSTRRSPGSAPRAPPATRRRRSSSTSSSSCGPSRASPACAPCLRDLITSLAANGNRFVLTSRYTARALRVLRDAPHQFEIIHVAPLGAAEIRATLPAGSDARPRGHRPLRGRGRPRARRAGAAGPGALRRTAGLRPHARRHRRPLWRRAAPPIRSAPSPRSSRRAAPSPLHCQYCYELRLHRARGYGALKAILEVLAEEEPLTLTEISLRLRRTPGSTKDYLSWLEDVDLIVSHQKRYSFADPMMRLWVRLHCRPAPPSDDDVVREVHKYVMSRLPAAEPEARWPSPGSASRRRNATRTGESSRSTSLRSDDWRHVQEPLTEQPRLQRPITGSWTPAYSALSSVSAALAAAWAASFLLFPSARVSGWPLTSTSTSNRRRCAGPISAARR